MQHIVQETVETLKNFIDHGEQSVMLIEAVTDEAPLLLKCFDIVERDELSNDIFLMHGDEFQDTRLFVETIIERQREQIEGVNEELEKRGDEKIEEIPPVLFERNAPSVERLTALFQHIRHIVQPERAIIWVFFPLADIERQDFYANLFTPVAQKIISGELGNTKLIIRDTPLNNLKENLNCDEQNPDVFCYRPELDFASVIKKIEDRAKDPNAPAEEKMQSLLLTAGMDVAEKRYDDALSKNEQALVFYRQKKLKQNESVVQSNMGDIYYVQGKYPEAQENYEKAIMISVEEKSQPMVLYQSINLGNALFMQEKYDEAFIYYDSAEKLADVNQVFIQRIQALERMGDTRRKQKELDEAVEIYNKAADLCRENKYAFGLKSVLERLCEVYAEQREQEKYDECKAELEASKAELNKVAPQLAESA
ncbi:hypothetical protein BH20ACI4_BH20ACI4_07270 [soil metagenome]